MLDRFQLSTKFKPLALLLSDMIKITDRNMEVDPIGTLLKQNPQFLEAKSSH